MATIFVARLPLPSLCSRRPILNSRTVIPTIDIVKFCSNGFPAPSFRSKNTQILQLRQRSSPISASDSSDRNPIKEEKDGSEATGGARGPPFLTILAGFLVFTFLCWIISSAVMSLLGTVVKFISSK